MVLNDTSKRQGLIQDCEGITALGDTAISGDSALLQNFTRGINRWLYKAAIWIWEAEGIWQWDDESKTDLPIVVQDLVDGQQDYPLPTSVATDTYTRQGDVTKGAALKLLRVEILDSNGDYRKLDQIDQSELGMALSEYEKTDGLPHSYDVFANSLLLYPAPATASVTITDGLKMYIARELDAFNDTDTTKEPGIAEPFHRILSLGASYDWLSANVPGRADAVKTDLFDLKRELQTFYGDRNKDKPASIQPRRENYR